MTRPTPGLGFPRALPDQLDDLVVVPDLMDIFSHRLAVAEKWAPVIREAAIENECEHERLPGDPSPPCGCFPQEGTAA